MPLNEKEIFNQILSIEKESLSTIYGYLGQSFNVEQSLNELILNHYDLRNLILVWNVENEIIMGLMRYRIISAQTILVTSFLINKNVSPVNVLSQLFKNIFKTFSLLDQEVIISEVYKLNRPSLNFQIKLGFTIHSESENRYTLIVQKDELLSKLKTYLR